MRDASRRPVPAVPSFSSKDSVLDAARMAIPHRGSPSVRGSTTSPLRGGPYSLVWWSPEPAALSLGAQAPFGLRRDDLIVKDVSPAVLRRYLDTYHRLEERSSMPPSPPRVNRRSTW